MFQLKLIILPQFLHIRDEPVRSRIDAVGGAKPVEKKLARRDDIRADV
jgi:hypothetical protein